MSVNLSLLSDSNQRPRDYKSRALANWAKEAKTICLLTWASCRIRTNDPEITNHVLWPTELKRRVGKLAISRRYNQLPLLRSSPGGFEGSWPYGTYPCLAVRIRHTPYPVAGAKVDIFFEHAIHFMKKSEEKHKNGPEHSLSPGWRYVSLGWRWRSGLCKFRFPIPPTLPETPFFYERERFFMFLYSKENWKTVLL